MRSMGIMAAILVAASAVAQTNAPTQKTSAPVTNAPSAFSSSWLVVPFGIWSTANHYGAGVAVLYELTPNIVAGGRLDYLNGAVWMPSMSLQLQAPLRLSKGLTLVPFTFTGAAVPLGGTGSGSATALLGAGLAVRLGSGVDAVMDVERWTGMEGMQIRAGIIWRF